MSDRGGGRNKLHCCILFRCDQHHIFLLPPLVIHYTDLNIITIKKITKKWMAHHKSALSAHFSVSKNMEMSSNYCTFGKCPLVFAQLVGRFHNCWICGWNTTDRWVSSVLCRRKTYLHNLNTIFCLQITYPACTSKHNENYKNNVLLSIIRTAEYEYQNQ